MYVNSLGGAAQVEEKLKSRGLKNLYVATDAPDKEFREFRSGNSAFSVTFLVHFLLDRKRIPIFKKRGIELTSYQYRREESVYFLIFFF